MERIAKIYGIEGSDAFQSVKNRIGQDLRYNMDDSRIRDLGWKPTRDFDASLQEIADTIENSKNTLIREGAEMLKEEDLGKKKLATIYINNDWGVDANKYFTLEARKLGAEIVAEEAFVPGEKDFTASYPN